MAAPSEDPKWEFLGHSTADPLAVNVGMMLNTDFEVFYDVTLDRNAQVLHELELHNIFAISFLFFPSGYLRCKQGHLELFD